MFSRSAERIPEGTQRSGTATSVPVKVGGETVGVLSADRLFEDRVPFDRDVQFLSIVAGSIAQAVRLAVRC